MWLRRGDGTATEGRAFAVRRKAEGAAQRAVLTPWRTLQIADGAAGLYMSDLILNLNEPNALGDVSWFRPAKYVGIWWSLHLDTGAGHRGRSTARPRRTRKRYIDFAAENGFRGVLVEGWNAAGTATGSRTARVRLHAAVSGLRPRSTRRLRANGRAPDRPSRDRRHHRSLRSAARSALDLYQRLGIDSVKTGYVADAGGIRAIGRRRPDPFRVARRAGHVAPSPEGRDRGGEAPHRGQSARADQGHRTAPHLSELGFARRRARHGIQRLGQARRIRPSTRPTSCSRACWRARWTSRRACSA